MNAKNNLIKKQKLRRYYEITSSALQIAKDSVSKGKEQEAKEIILMVECYLSDSKHFENQGNYVNAYGCLNYAHGWLDCGARLKVFNVSDSNLFTI
jgi:uncharacterized protein